MGAGRVVQTTSGGGWNDLRAGWCRGCSLISCGGSNRPLKLVSVARTASALTVPAASVSLIGTGRVHQLLGSVPRKWL